MLKAIEKSGLEIQLTSLTEVLILIVFVLLLSISDVQSVLTKEQLTIENLKRQVAEKNAEINKLNQEQLALKAELEGTRTTIALLKDYMDPLKDRDEISDEDLIATFKDLINVNKGLGGSPAQIIAGKNKRIRELEAELEASGTEIDRITKALAGGIDKPNCFVKGMQKSYSEIATVELRPNGYSVSGSWEPITEDEAAGTVPGLMAFSRGFLTQQEFSEAGNQVYRWSDQQKRKCRFRVNVKTNSESFSSPRQYEKSLGLVERYFYIRKLRNIP